MSEWRAATLGEVARVQSGFAFKSRDWQDSGVAVVKIQNVRGGRVNLTGCSYVSEQIAAAASRFRLQRGDVLVTMSGEIGSVGVVRSEGHIVLNQRVGRLQLLDAGAAEMRYLTYVLQDPALKQIMETIAYGAAQPNISPALIASLPISLPDRVVQLRIASVLEAIDDLIENNLRRVEVLREMARAIYREWFVKFRYPGHSEVPLVDSAPGPIPEGWEISTCGAELNFIGGGTPSKKEPSYWNDGAVPWYTPTDLTRTGWRYAAEPELRITESGVAKSSARLFPTGSVMMTSRATLGVLAIATTEATTNQGFIVILPDERWSSGFIYEWLDSKAVELAAIDTGATFKEITKGSFKSFPFIVPSQQVLDAHRAVIEPIEKQVHFLEQQTRNLSVLRDTLLPKLVTGHIDLSTLDLDALLSPASNGESAVG